MLRLAETSYRFFVSLRMTQRNNELTVDFRSDCRRNVKIEA